MEVDEWTHGVHVPGRQFGCLLVLADSQEDVIDPNRGNQNQNEGDQVEEVLSVEVALAQVVSLVSKSWSDKRGHYVVEG